MKIAKRAQAYIDRLKATDILTKQELINMCSYVNNHRRNSTALLATMFTVSPRNITWQHEQLGLVFLKKTFLKKNGQPRQHKGIQHLQPGEIDSVCHILQNFERFELIGFANASSNSRSYYQPQWRCYATDGSYFDYTQMTYPFRLDDIHRFYDNNVVKLSK